MKFIATAKQVTYKRILATAGALIPLALPTVAYAAPPATISQGVTDTEKLLSSAATWAFALIAAGAALFMLRALWTMHSADDDSQYAKGRKHLIRSIWTLVVAGCVSAIIATLKAAYGF